MIEKITNPNKYCDECRKKIEESKKPKKIKKIVCQDCGKEFVTRTFDQQKNHLFKKDGKKA